MNFVRHGILFCPQWAAVGVILFTLGLAGCGDQVELSDSQALLEFFNAGPVGPSLDMNRLVKARMDTGPYRLLPDEAIELTMPSILKVVTAEESVTPEETETYVCRVNEQGMIPLPIVGDIPAAGRTLAQIESAVVNAYYPHYTKSRPSVFAKVLEYKTFKVSVIGTVKEAGVYELRWDQMSLVNALMQAGGIFVDVASPGAAAIKINRITSQSPLATPSLLRPAAALTSNASGTSQKSISLATYGGDASAQAQDDIQLSFRPNQPGQTLGQLAIGYQGQTLVNQSVDIANDTQLFHLLDQAVARAPRLPVYELSQRLKSLTDVLYNGSVGRPVQFARATANNQPSIEFASAQSDLGALGMPLTKASPGESEIVLPVKGINIPFADVALHDGDTISVERFSMPLFTVIGLVGQAGNYDYPPEANYNLIQAIGFAGDLDLALDPRYVTIYRLKKDGTVANAIFKLKQGSRLSEDLAVPILPGDIVAVEHTPRTRRKEFVNRVFRLNTGLYFNPGDFLDD
ncbi:MAG: polysaccharide biosynthesis/export family protein [Phycisphaeraceae bacterium]|nr:polysaccharide biosynthesis/export family protein [Phycisphaeraceae bacterium]